MQKELISGIHAVQAVLERRPQSVVTLWLDEERSDRRLRALEAQAAAAGVAVRRVPRRRLDKLAGEARHQGAVARCQSLPLRGERELEHLLEGLGRAPLLLVLDGVQDPRNFGACLRSADGAGVDAVIVPRSRTSPVTAVARRAASGAAETVALFQVGNLARTLESLKAHGVWLLGAEARAQVELFEMDLTGPLALVIGAEDKGLRRLTRAACDTIVRIPMAGTVQSLNISVATAVCLYEARRQRGGSGRR